MASEPTASRRWPRHAKVPRGIPLRRGWKYPDGCPYRGERLLDAALFIWRIALASSEQPADEHGCRECPRALLLRRGRKHNANASPAGDGMELQGPVARDTAGSRQRGGGPEDDRHLKINRSEG